MSPVSHDILRLLVDARRARTGGPAAIARRQHQRLAAIVAHARAHSPYYQRLYQGLPDRVEDPRLLPVTTKRELMAHFDDWVADDRVTLEKAQAFASDPTLVGTLFQDKYEVQTSSGSTGVKAVFLHDRHYRAVTKALTARTFGRALGLGGVARVLATGTRLSTVFATDGHFASASFNARARGRSRLQALSAHAPVPELVDQLNRFRPAILLGYASVVSLLTDERQAGRLRIHPTLIGPTSEGLTPQRYDQIAAAFDGKVRAPYGASEFGGIAYGCQHHWLHVNADWVILEPVDADHQATPPGELSHTVLLTNLTNPVQPILRYDIGDAILTRPDPCPCGDPLPAMRVRGRTADTLTFRTARDTKATMTPLAFGTLLDTVPGLRLYQLVQNAPTGLQLRFQVSDNHDADQVWQAARDKLNALLAQHGLAGVTVERATEPPEQSASGKYRRVVPLTR